MDYRERKKKGDYLRLLCNGKVDVLGSFLLAEVHEIPLLEVIGAESKAQQARDR